MAKLSTKQVAELARRYGRTERTLYRWMRKGIDVTRPTEIIDAQLLSRSPDQSLLTRLDMIVCETTTTD